MKSDRIYICDVPPRGVYVLTVPVGVTDEQCARFAHAFRKHAENLVASPALVFVPEGWRIEYLPPLERTWPDAEFCAA